jgi:hypothetical protein
MRAVADVHSGADFYDDIIAEGEGVLVDVSGESGQDGAADKVGGGGGGEGHEADEAEFGKHSGGGLFGLFMSLKKLFGCVLGIEDQRHCETGGESWTYMVLYRMSETSSWVALSRVSAL